MAQSLASKLIELSMVPELAKVVAGAICGLPELRGTFTLNGTTAVTVANANLAAGDQVSFTLETAGGTVGATPTIKTRTNGTGFTVAGTAADTSVYSYRILKG